MRHRSNYYWMLFLTSPMAFVYRLEPMTSCLLGHGCSLMLNIVTSKIYNITLLYSSYDMVKLFTVWESMLTIFGRLLTPNTWMVAKGLFY